MIITTLSVLLLATAIAAQDLSKPSCLLDQNNVFELTLTSCDPWTFQNAVEAAIAAVQQQQGPDACGTWEEEIILITQEADLETEFEIWEMCFEATMGEEKVDSFMTFRDVFLIGGFIDAQEDEEFFNGGTSLNTQYDGAPGATPLNQAAKFVSDLHSSVMSGPLIFPGDQDAYMEGFEDCDANAVTCCYVADRQSDGFGTCNGGNCEDSDPVDNTDVCFVDNQVSQFAGHTEGGFSIFPADSEGPVYCEGFVWPMPEVMDANYRYRGNILYEVALKENLFGKGYVREVPGAPMCGCVNKMPVISDAACTEVVADEEFKFTFVFDEWPTLEYKFNSLSFKSCTEGSLSARMAKLASDGLLEPETKSLFDSFVTGGSCSAATASFLSEKGLVV